MVGSVSMQFGGLGGQIDFSALRQQRAAKMFQRMDADGSGAVSKEEFANWDKQMRERMPQAGGAGSMPSNDEIFSALDSDGDGSLSQTEVASLGEKMRALRQAQMFKEADADGNGSVSQGEFSAWHDKVQIGRARVTEVGQGPSADEVFASADADGDGGLSAAEFSALGQAGAAQGAHRGPPPGGGGSGGPGGPGGPSGAGGPGGAGGGGLLDALDEEDDEDSSSTNTQLDANGDGKVTLQEFVNWLKNYAATQGQDGQGASGSAMNFVA